MKLVAGIVAVSMLTRAFEVLQRHLADLRSSAERYRSSTWRAERRQRLRAVKIVEAEQDESAAGIFSTQPFAGVLFVVGAILCYLTWSISPQAEFSDQIIPLISSFTLVIGTISNYELFAAMVGLGARASRVVFALMLASVFAALAFSEKHLISRFLSIMIAFLVLRLIHDVWRSSTKRSPGSSNS